MGRSNGGHRGMWSKKSIATMHVVLAGRYHGSRMIFCLLLTCGSWLFREGQKVIGLVAES